MVRTEHLGNLQEGRTPVWVAAGAGHVRVLKFLNTCGVNFETPNEVNEMPFVLYFILSFWKSLLQT